MPYTAQHIDIGLCFTTCTGVPIPREEAIDAICEILKTISRDDYESYIEVRRKEIDEMWRHPFHDPKPKRKPNQSSVYLMECGGKYKIGISKDVARRVKELDKRPFKINVVATSEMFEDAFMAERVLHSQCDKYRIDGEWFALPDNEIDAISEKIFMASSIDWDSEEL